MKTKKYRFTAQMVIERLLSDEKFRDDLLTLILGIAYLANRVGQHRKS